MIPLAFQGFRVSAASTAGESRATRCRVLVVEDDPSSRRALTALLRLRGFESVFAASLSEGIDRLAWQPTCVLLDLMLPDGNGAALVEHIRRNRLPIRIAVTTGASNWSSMLNSPDAQPDIIFTKPLDIDRLVKWLDEPT